VANRDNIYQGRYDSALTVNGIQQMLLIGNDIRIRDISADIDIYTSPLPRCRTSTALISANLSSQSILNFIDMRLIERNYGVWEGLSHKQISEDRSEEWLERQSIGSLYTPPKGETRDLIKSRVLSFLYSIREPGSLKPKSNNSIIIVTHKEVSLALRQLISGHEDLEAHDQTAYYEINPDVYFPSIIKRVINDPRSNTREI
jgi:broad specificity phosphatase PhoE